MSSLWFYEKGVYSPPEKSKFPNVIKKEIQISPHIHDEIGKIIGKNGKHFIHLTQKYNLLYIFYIDNKIELYGLNEYNLHGAIYEIIKRIKYMNYIHRQSLLEKNQINDKED